MLKKWDVAPAPTDKNQGRHKLLINGEMKDIFLIVKKLGSLCSRPEKASGEFNFIIYLSKLEIDTMKKLKDVMSELSKPVVETEEEVPGTSSFAAPRPAPQTAPPPVEKPKPAPAPAPQAAPPPADKPRPAPAPAPQAALPPADKPKPAPAPAPQAEPPPADKPKPAPAPAPQAAPPPAEKPKPGPAPRSGMSFVPSATSRIKAEDVAPKEPVKAPEQEPAPSESTISARIKAKWSMELPLIPTYSFQTLIAGSHNRFAHAAAMAVVENPGVIYNPLLLFGPPGSGKTHFINSISYGLSASVGQGNIFVTDGIRLSKGIELAVRDGAISRLDGLFSSTKVLIIDDVHLLMVTDANKKYLSKWLNDFVAQNKQIVVSSVFPPKALSGLEEAVGFEFTQGWMVDLKPPAAQSYKSILSQLMQGLEVRLSESEMSGTFAGSGSAMPLNEAARVLDDAKKLERLIVNAMNNLSHAQLLDMLLGISEPALASALTEEDVRESSSWQPSALDSAWFKWGLFYPSGMKNEAQFVLYGLRECAKELGLSTEWSQVFLEEYNSDEMYGIPFRIGNFASDHNVNGVIVIGPQPTSALGAQENEFRHITSKILDSFRVKGAWISLGKLKSKAAYARMLMDLI